MKSIATPSAEFTDEYGDKLAIASLDQDSFLVRINPGPNAQPDLSGVVLKIADAPAIALAILTAAGVTPAPYDAADSLQRALAQLEEHEGIRRNQNAAAKLTRRRDELAAQLFDLPVYELHPGPFTYFDSTEVVRAAIDMIIQLQDEATK